jgi:hypothetical protein
MHAERLYNRQLRELGDNPTNIWAELNQATRSGVPPLQLAVCIVWGALVIENPQLSISALMPQIRNPLELTRKVCEAILAYLRFINPEEVGDADHPLDRPNGSISPPPPESS